jgi:tetratricopeptide (TPR) repeat protein
MNLFVMPVTTRLLTTPNRARDVEFPYAIEHHIPVLPLMQETGLEELFNRVCGDLQFLSKLDKDPTAIPYEEKLTNYLKGVLIGDELAARVRAAFDAHIFLSYRKKDRALAQELMRLIHKNDFFRDVAIWYDEFLIPGENFNEAIERALKGCDLFALAVTPNLVNEKNYVMTTEYPMAKKAERRILPAEVSATDRAELALLFDGIPEGIDAHDPEALAAALARALEDTVLRENDHDPQHNFFIGLAYLSGIDVEVDHARAVELITGAAEAGIPEAMGKLVSMYRNGEGVKRSYETAIEWQKKLVGHNRKLYEAEPGEKNGYRLFSALRNLGNYIYELRRLDDAEAVYTEMKQLAEEMHTAKSSASARRNLCLRLLVLVRKIKKPSASARRNLSVSLSKLGDIRTARGDLDGAED